MKNIKEKLIPSRERPAHFQNAVTDGAGSNIVQLQEGGILENDTVQLCLSCVCFEKHILLALTMLQEIEHRI